MPELPIDALTELVIGCAMAVHSELGPGLLESIYRDCLRIELLSRGLTVETEKQVPVFYKGQRIRSDLRIDLLVDGRLVIEVKAVDRLHPVHQAQVITYLKLYGVAGWPAPQFQRHEHPSRSQTSRSSGCLRPKAQGTAREAKPIGLLFS